MKHCPIKVFVVTGLLSGFSIAQAETELGPLVPSDSECIEPTLLQRVFTTESVIDCSKIARYHRSAAWLDSDYMAGKRSDEEYRSTSKSMSGPNPTSDSTLVTFDDMQPLAEFRNISVSTRSSQKRQIDTVKGYQTLEPTD